MLPETVWPFGPKTIFVQQLAASDDGGQRGVWLAVGHFPKGTGISAACTQERVNTSHVPMG